MRRSVLATALAAALLVSGCLAAGPASPADGTATTPPGATETPHFDGGSDPTGASGTGTDSPTPTDDGKTAEYVVRAGAVPDEFARVTLTLRVVFVEMDGDLGPCYRGMFRGPYKPTPTPVPTPTDDCHRSEPFTVTLTDLEAPVTVANVSVPDAATGHAVLVTNVRATYENGTTVSAIKGVGGHVALESMATPHGTYGIEFGFEAAPTDYPYDYWLVSGRFEASG